MGVFFPGAGSAQPEASSDRDELRSRVKRLIKRSTREGLIYHNLKAYLRPYDKHCTFVIGRQKKSDDHDVMQSFSQRKEFLKRRWRVKPTGHETLFFSDLEIRITDDDIEAELETRLHFFGGAKHEKTLFKIKAQGKKLRIVHARIWPTFETIGGATFDYGEHYWATTDDLAFTAILSTGSSWRKILDVSLAAHWHPLLHAYLRDLAKVRPRDPEVWKALSAVAYLIGDMKESRKASRRARRLDPNISLPAALR